MNNELSVVAKNIRKKIIETLVPKESHHIGCSLSIVDILVHLYYKEMKIFPEDPKNKDRDIFILSKGHGALALYVTLWSKGFFDDKLLSSYDVNGGILPEHASTIAPGVELSTGSLGHGLPVGVGFALAKKRVFVLMSDGEFDEGSNWEAIMFAGFHKLKNLIVVVDINKFQGYGSTEKVLDLSSLSKKLDQFNWETYEIDGHNFEELKTVFEDIKKSKLDKPKIIFANTIKGKGVKFFEGKFESHYKSLDDDLKAEVLESL